MNASIESEVRDLHRAVVALLQLEVAGALTVDDALPDGDLRPREVRREAIVGPRVAIPPVPAVADRLVQTAVRRDADRGPMHERHRRIGGVSVGVAARNCSGDRSSRYVRTTSTSRLNRGET